MTTITRILILMLIGVVLPIKAQEFQGVATYKTHRAFDIKMDSTKINDAMQKEMMEMMKKKFQKTYSLIFDKTSSLYKQEVELDKPQVGSGFQVMSLGSDDSDVFYKNMKHKTYVYQKETMGKKFLIKDTISPIQWELESDTKYIGEYMCFKATSTKQVPKVNYNAKNNSKLDRENEETKAPEMEERTITAWYTPQIPVSNGPSKYQGLPGLILEIHDGKLTMVCTKIVINPEEKAKIIAPTKGKEVNQTEYDEIMAKKRKELQERYAPRRGSKDSGIHITIQG